ncbi:hypothetical protein B0H10DRAFT_1943265 [Mycena sp. CBHHK59/15]|nr:hypothetical protein B0H10DRAFT_1943265 [Mycena sp. CBHHK59/15]
MISSAANPSNTSIDSTTALAVSYRPPQKDYAAAFASLHDKYGPTGLGRRVETSVQPVVSFGQGHTAPKSSAPRQASAPSTVPVAVNQGDTNPSRRRRWEEKDAAE